MLLRERIQAIPLDQADGDAVIQQQTYRSLIVKSPFRPMVPGAHLVISRRSWLADNIEQFSATMEAIIASGEMEEIFARHGVVYPGSVLPD